MHLHPALANCAAEHIVFVVLLSCLKYQQLLLSSDAVGHDSSSLCIDSVPCQPNLLLSFFKALEGKKQFSHLGCFFLWT